MILAGLQKNSFIDYPGRISCVLFVSGCNFSCPYCHNADLARGRYPAKIESAEILDFLRRRRGMLEGVVITGGEPTLDDGLAGLCASVKSLGYPVKLDTNGSRPEVLGRLLEGRLIDFIAMDVKAPLDAYGPFCRLPHIRDALGKSIRLIMDRAPAYEFRTTCAAPFADEAAIAAIAATIRGAASYVLQAFNPRAACLDPDFNRRTNPSLDTQSMQRLQRLAEPHVLRCTLR
ncbi:MAG TPA: anaerobic ribonucleoside-triphosphate reductase activating protein [Desulfosarcina sp.]|nr:anaerobic ribonucleoside-triphosphate reductase activating protein [Desulfosarcina sp.]